MVIWLTILCYVLFSFYIFIKYVKTETLNKSFSTFIHLYSILSLVSSVAHTRLSKQINTLTWGLA